MSRGAVEARISWRLSYPQSSEAAQARRSGASLRHAALTLLGVWNRLQALGANGMAASDADPIAAGVESHKSLTDGVELRPDRIVERIHDLIVLQLGCTVGRIGAQRINVPPLVRAQA